MTTSPLKSPEAMSKLKTPEELAREMHPNNGPLSFVDREHIAHGIIYTREHEVAPLVEALRLALIDLQQAQDETDIDFRGSIIAVNEALTLYTNEVK